MKARWVAAAAGLLAVAACDAVPRDSYGALERIRREHVVRVGLVDSPPWVEADGGGLEPALVAAWAQAQGARPAYRVGALDQQVEALHRRELDVLVAGLDAKTPYAKHIAVSQVYLEARDPNGTVKKRVVAVAPGESGLLLSLDRFLKAQDPAALNAQLRARRP